MSVKSPHKDLFARWVKWLYDHGMSKEEIAKHECINLQQVELYLDIAERQVSE